eukprot:TRINITY_DN9321_c0_g1_i13.p1 TRINITY_DN9321_c0_g1~~TRINITY_DN9321_c0_g1_i13.p1  ORF type:complete len:131 (+),score=42.25 TRINITY_DN9321_c0_g1_i13:46-438(+)
MYFFFFFFFFKQKTAYEMLRSLVGSEMCIRDSINAEYGGQTAEECSTAPAAGSDHVQRGNLDPRRRGRHQRLAIRMGWHAFRPRRSLLGLAGLGNPAMAPHQQPVSCCKSTSVMTGSVSGMIKSASLRTD